MNPEECKGVVPGIAPKGKPSIPQCSICQKIDRESQNLLQSLYKKIREKLKNSGEAYDESLGKEDKVNYQKNFKNLIDVMFGRKFSQAQLNCSHITLCTSFQKKLRCSQQNLSKTCQEILTQIGSKSYQIDLLKKQFSNLQKHSFLMTAEKADSPMVKIQEKPDPPKQNKVKTEEAGQVKEELPTMNHMGPTGPNFQQPGMILVFPVPIYQQVPNMNYQNSGGQQ